MVPTRQILFLILFLVPSTLVRAQSISFVPAVFSYNTGDYKAGNKNWAIAQGHDGVIYIGNNEGLLSFDGTNWNLHTLPNGLAVKSILVKMMGEEERIYVGSFEEFGYFVVDETNRLVYHSLLPLLVDYHFLNDEFWTITTQDENIFFQSFRSYFVYHAATSTIHHTRPHPAPLYFFEVNNRMYAQMMHEDFYGYNNGVFEPLFSRDRVNNDHMVAILPFDNHYLLVSSENGLFQFQPADGTVQAWKTDIDDRLQRVIANRAILSHDSLIIIGTLKDGVYAIDRNGQKRWILNHLNGLNNNTVLGLKLDKEGNVWAALDNGISYIQTHSGLSFLEPADVQPGLVMDILLHNEHFYLAAGHGVYRYSMANRTMGRVPGLDEQSWYIRLFGDQIITGNNRGTAFLENGSVTHAQTTIGGMDIKQAVLHNQDVLIESTYVNMNVYRKNAAGKWVFSHSVSNFHDLISKIEIDHTGNIWAQHKYRGIYRLRLNAALNRVVEEEFFPYLETDRSATPTFIRIMKLKGRIILSDGTRFYTYDDITHRVIPFDRLNIDLKGFKDAIDIVSINETLFWLIRDHEYTLIEYRDGEYAVKRKIPFAMLNNPPNKRDGSVFVDEYGNSFLALNGGIAHFATDVDFAMPVDRLRLRKVSTYNANTNTQHVLPIRTNRFASIKYTDNHVTFAFQYTHFARQSFTIETQLEHYNVRWMPVGNDLKVSYANLPAGDYTLYARVMNDLGEELSALSFSFRIKPPWYRTIWLMAVYVLLLLTLAYFLIRWYIRRAIRKRKRIFEKQEKARLAHIEKQEKKIATLTNERLESDLLHKSKELASATMNIINHNEFLDKLKDELKAYILAGKVNKMEGNKLLTLINEQHSKQDDWAVFQENFDLIHENFFRKLQDRYPALTPTDLKLCALLNLNYSSKEIANMLNLTIRGVEAARYRLRKKLNLQEEENLVAFMMEFR